MDSRKLLFSEYIALLEEMPHAEKTDIGGGLDIYEGHHPTHGEVVIACAMGEHSVLITSDTSQPAGHHGRIH